MQGFLTRALRIRKVLLGRDFYQCRQVRRKRLTLGNRFAEWTISPEGIDRESIVYSFGVGEDISWDLGMIERFGAKIHAFDPSPRSIGWITEQDLPEGFIFHPFGLAGEDGEIIFYEPPDPGARSLRISGSGKEQERGEKHSLPVHRLDTIKEILGHEHIDILKMDIEGAEYGVIEDVVDAAGSISQVLIEFHHRFSNIGVEETRKAIRELNRAGFGIFHVSSTGEEISFIRE